MAIKLLEGEHEIKKGKANKFNFFMSKGGHLMLTNQRLIFLDHSLNFTSGTAPIELKNIMSVDKAVTWTIYMIILPIPNGIKIRTQDGQLHKYTVFGRKKWIQAIADAMNA